MGEEEEEEMGKCGHTGDADQGELMSLMGERMRAGGQRLGAEGNCGTKMHTGLLSGYEEGRGGVTVGEKIEFILTICNG